MHELHHGPGSSTNIQPRLTMVGDWASFGKYAGQGHIFFAEKQPTRITLTAPVAGRRVVPGPSLSILMVMGPPPARQMLAGEAR